MAEERTIDDAITLLDMISKMGEATIAFKKRTTGEMRVMRCTLNFKVIPKEKRPASVNLKRILTDLQKNKLLRVFDIEKMDWRSVTIDSIQCLTDDNNNLFKIKL